MSDENFTQNLNSDEFDTERTAKVPEYVENGSNRSQTPSADSVNEPEEDNSNSSNNAQIIGKVASPPRKESTSDQFHFWVKRDELVEKTQIVRTESKIGNDTIQFFGVIEEVFRQSRKKDIGEEFDAFDGDVDYEPEFKSEGVTFATATILRTQPPVLAPPFEQSSVFLGGESEAESAYGFDEMKKPMPVGLLKNGGSNYAGLAKIDLAYLLGDYSGHLNVSGMTGAATKTSFLLTIIKCLLHQAPQKSKKDPLYIVPIILNVKGEDLMWIDRPSKEFQKDSPKCEEDWQKLGISPEPFEGTQFFSPTEPNSNGAPMIDGCNATAYSWSLTDVLANGLFTYLFSDDSLSSAMTFLVNDIVAQFTDINGKPNLPQEIQTWNNLLTWIRDQASTPEAERQIRNHQTGTWRAVSVRLSDILTEGDSIFPRNARSGNPLKVTRSKTSPPQVIDIHSLPTSLQRFVVAAIFEQVKAARKGRHAVRGLRYLLVLDELNRFAPRQGKDPITQLLENVATEMRSQGVILLGGQQFASQVSTKIIESAAVRVLGRTGVAELQEKVWQGWDKTARQQASLLKLDEKLIMQTTFRQPMFVKMPFPAWAMRREDIASKPLQELPEI
ncbi:MAG: ATP-binding protein [Halothece sp.]